MLCFFVFLNWMIRFPNKYKNCHRSKEKIIAWPRFVQEQTVILKGRINCLTKILLSRGLTNNLLPEDLLKSEQLFWGQKENYCLTKIWFKENNCPEGEKKIIAWPRFCCPEGGKKITAWQRFGSRTNNCLEGEKKIIAWPRFCCLEGGKKITAWPRFVSISCPEGRK